MKPIRLAVVGAGIMGSNHVRVANSLPDISVAAVVDIDRSRAEALAATCGAAVFTSVDDIDVPIDAAVIAAPTAFHVDAASSLAARGAHLLVEKPLAIDIAGAKEIIRVCAESGVVLAVGHIERFNSAVAELARFLDEPLHIDASRISPYSPRIGDGVIADLMIHDIDAVLSLAGPSVSVRHASGVVRCVHGEAEDLASVVAVLDNDWTVHFSTSRLGQSKTRRIEVTQRDSVVVADLLQQSIVIHRMTRHEYLGESGTTYRQSSVTEVPFLENRGEPLARELSHFAECVRTGASPLVTGTDGLRALQVVEFIRRSVL